MQRPRKRLRLSNASSTGKRLALRFAFKGARSLVKSRMRKRTAVDAPALTFQHDAQWVYRRRPAPRRLKARVRSRRQGILKVISSTLPENVYRFDFIYRLTAAVDTINYAFFPLYSGNMRGTNYAVDATDSALHSQLEQMHYHYYPIATNTTNLLTALDETLTFTNATGNLLINSSSQNGSVVYVTVAHLWCRRDFVGTAQYLYQEGIAEKAAGYNGNGNIVKANTVPLTDTDNTNGMFDSSLLCRHFIIKNIRHFRLSANSNVDLQLRDRREYTINRQEHTFGDLSSTLAPGRTMGCLAKYTEGYFVIFKGFPNNTVNSASVTLNMNWNVDYKVRVPQANVSVAALNIGVNP